MRLSFKYCVLDLACQTAEKVKKMSHGVQVMPNYRVNLISSLINRMMLATAIELGKYADDV